MSYAPANNELDDADMIDLDAQFLVGSHHSSYTTTVQNILNRHNAEIKTNTDPIIQPLHQVSRKRLRELVQRHNNELFKFLEHPDRTPNSLGIAETLFRKFGQEPPTVTRTVPPISRELMLDTSMNVVVTELDTVMAKDTNVPGTLQTLTTHMKWAFNQYKMAGEEVMRLEALLNQKTEILDKHHSRLNVMMTLKNNEALPALLDAFHGYSTEIFKEANFETTYKELAEAYKKWNVLRELITFQNITSPDTKEPLCAICLADPITHTVVPCGHTFCTSCVRRIKVSCYLCRGPVRERVKLFFT
jgi:hypothetical protein